MDRYKHLKEDAFSYAFVFKSYETAENNISKL